MLAALPFKPARETKVDQRVQRDITNHEDVTTAAAITTVRTTELLVFLVPKRGTAIAPISGGDVDQCFVYKFHNGILGNSAHSQEGFAFGQQKSPRSGLWHWVPRITEAPTSEQPAYSAGVMLTMLRFNAPLTAN